MGVTGGNHGHVTTKITKGVSLERSEREIGERERSLRSLSDLCIRRVAEECLCLRGCSAGWQADGVIIIVVREPFYHRPASWLLAPSAPGPGSTAAGGGLVDSSAELTAGSRAGPWVSCYDTFGSLALKPGHSKACACLYAAPVHMPLQHAGFDWLGQRCRIIQQHGVYCTGARTRREHTCHARFSVVPRQCPAVYKCTHILLHMREWLKRQMSKMPCVCLAPQRGRGPTLPSSVQQS